MKKYFFEGDYYELYYVKEKLEAYEKTILDKTSRYYEIHKLINKDLIGLDYGCGFGVFAKIVAKKSKKVFGIDHSKNEIEVCRKIHSDVGNLEFQFKPITEFKRNSFDFVLSNQVIEHVHNPGQYLSNINRVLKNNGELIISIPNISTPRHFLVPLSKRHFNYLKKNSRKILKSYDKTNLHINSWDPIHFTHLLGTCGFEIEEFIETEGVALPQQITKIGLPSYINTNTRFKGWSYTLVFKFLKKKEVTIDPLD